MAGTRRTDLLGRLADMSEEAIQRLSDTPGADKLVGAFNTLPRALVRRFGWHLLAFCEV